MLKKATPNLMVEDVNRVVEFYRDILTCFELVDSEPVSGSLEWAMLRCGEVQLMFESRRSLSKIIPLFKDKEIGGSLVIYIELSNIKSLYYRIKDKVKIIQDLSATDYGTLEFIIQDCNGFVLVFAEWVGTKDFFEKTVKKKK